MDWRTWSFSFFSSRRTCVSSSITLKTISSRSFGSPTSSRSCFASRVEVSSGASLSASSSGGLVTSASMSISSGFFFVSWM